MLGPAKADGRPWDGTGTVPEGLPKAIGKALSLSNPYSAVADVLADPMMHGIEKPEPSGKAWLLVRGQEGTPVPLVFPNQRDTCTPLWDGPPQWHGVSLDGSARLRVQLLDRDAMFDDPVGVFELTNTDFIAALNYGRIFHIKVSDQTQNQVLFAGISVFAE